MRRLQRYWPQERPPTSETTAERRRCIGRSGSRMSRWFGRCSPPARDIDAADETGDTPLHWAVSTRFETTVAALLAAGADVDATNAEGDTPLHRAALEGPDAVVAALIAAGADVNARNKDGETPLHAAVESRSLATIDVLLAAGGGCHRKGRIRRHAGG